MAYKEGAYDKAQQYFEESLRLYCNIANADGIAETLTHLGSILQKTGDYTEAKTYYQQVLMIVAEIGNLWHKATALARLGQVSIALGDLKEAKAYFYQALTLAIDISALPIVLATVIDVVSYFRDQLPPTQVLTLLTYVYHHPASDEEIKNRALALFYSLEPNLSLNTFRKAKDQGLNHQLPDVIQEVIDLLH